MVPPQNIFDAGWIPSPGEALQMQRFVRLSSQVRRVRERCCHNRYFSHRSTAQSELELDSANLQ